MYCRLAAEDGYYQADALRNLHIVERHTGEEKSNMGRGLGKVQRRVLECLEASGDSSFGTLIEWIYGVGNYGENPSHRVSVSRAVAGLEKQGLVKKRDCTGPEEDQLSAYGDCTIGFGHKMVVLVKR